jgi:hypothetical protein
MQPVGGFQKHRMADQEMERNFGLVILKIHAEGRDHCCWRYRFGEGRLSRRGLMQGSDRDRGRRRNLLLLREGKRAHHDKRYQERHRPNQSSN